MKQSFWDTFSKVLMLAFLWGFIMVVGIVISKSVNDREISSFTGTLEGSSIKTYCDYQRGNLLYLSESGGIAVIAGGCDK